MKNSIDVLIPTINRQKEILDCLDSINKQTVKPDNIIIIDASDSDELNKILNYKYKDLSIEYIHSDKGLPHQRNIGIQYIKSKWVLFLDDDIVLQYNFIEEAFRAIEVNEEYSCLTGSIINHNRKSKVNPLMILFQKLFYLSKSCIAGFNKSGTYNVNHPALRGPIEVGVAIGCLSMYKSDIFNKYKFDENYQYLEGYASYEDEDFSLQIRHDNKILYCTDTKAYHNRNTGCATRLSIYRGARIRAFNHRYLYRKHKTYYNFKPIPHFVSCFGMVIESILKNLSFTMTKGLIVGFILFMRKKRFLEKA